MFNFDFAYDLINILLVVVMCSVGHYVANNKKYWKYSIWAVASFTLVEGIRYGRGVDYMHYIDVYKYDLEEEQFLFTSLNKFLKSLGVSAEMAFLFYAFPFILGAMQMLKPMRKYAAFMFPLFLISIISNHEAFIRQMLAMSFVFMYTERLYTLISKSGIKKLNIKDITLLSCLAFIAYSIHSIAIVGIFVITLVILCIRAPFSWYYTIPLLIIGKFFISNSFDWSSLESFLSFLGSTNDKFSSYTENADRWFSDDAMEAGFTRNVTIQFLETFGCCAILYLSDKMFKTMKTEIEGNNRIKKFETVSFDLAYYISLFNIFVIGMLVFETFSALEIVRRVAFCWNFFWFAPMALILYYRKSKIFNRFDRFLMLGFSFWLWEYIRFLFVWSNTPLFIWDI